MQQWLALCAEVNIVSVFSTDFPIANYTSIGVALYIETDIGDL